LSEFPDEPVDQVVHERYRLRRVAARIGIYGNVVLLDTYG
jgi:hypothetical protein